MKLRTLITVGILLFGMIPAQAGWWDRMIQGLRNSLERLVLQIPPAQTGFSAVATLRVPGSAVERRMDPRYLLMRSRQSPPYPAYSDHLILRNPAQMRHLGQVGRRQLSTRSERALQRFLEQGVQQEPLEGARSPRPFHEQLGRLDAQLRPGFRNCVRVLALALNERVEERVPRAIQMGFREHLSDVCASQGRIDTWDQLTEGLFSFLTIYAFPAGKMDVDDFVQRLCNALLAGESFDEANAVGWRVVLSFIETGEINQPDDLVPLASLLHLARAQPLVCQLNEEEIRQAQEVIKRSRVSVDRELIALFKDRYYTSIANEHVFKRIAELWIYTTALARLSAKIGCQDRAFYALRVRLYIRLVTHMIRFLEEPGEQRYDAVLEQFYTIARMEDYPKRNEF